LLWKSEKITTITVLQSYSKNFIERYKKFNKIALRDFFLSKYKFATKKLNLFGFLSKKAAKNSLIQENI